MLSKLRRGARVGGNEDDLSRWSGPADVKYLLCHDNGTDGVRV